MSHVRLPEIDLERLAEALAIIGGGSQITPTREHLIMLRRHYMRMVDLFIAANAKRGLNYDAGNFP